jgi:hypothetical protein
MKYLFKLKIFIILTSISINSFASEEKNVEIKKGGAVTEFNKEDGFKLSKKSLKYLDIKFESISGKGPWKVPKSSIIRIKHSVGVYRKWDGWITLVLVTILNEGEEYVTIKSIDLEAKDEIASSGVTFLRMTEADLNSDTVDACAH